ncbi:hypothetical protein LSCM1_00454 [Leishmania martiniquensis]|uniref:Uncharacterized protein n=1 Tax=Leishmania martiniquensis TaxID=1580590 RepID=A0A836KG35_9TRYP|nr:hypothetical protein LSCM1_00454 [Leishmania martiniquensis]
MEGACPFQPQINPRSRRLARHAPTLRERQEQDELRRSAAREDRHGLQQQGLTMATPEAQEFARDMESDIVESVWDLWRGVAKGEARETEASLVRHVHTVNGDPLPQRRPRVVYLTTVLGMLNSLGITSPQHDALIAKFLAAMAVEGSALEALKRVETVDAARFVHVFSTVWRAAVTNNTLSSPAPARVSVSPGSPPAAQRRGNSASGPAIHLPYTEDSRQGASPSRMQAAQASERFLPKFVSSGSSASAVSARSSSSPSPLCSGDQGREGQSNTGFESASPSTGSGAGEERGDAAERDADYLRTSISDASFSASDSAEKRDGGVLRTELTPKAMEPSGALVPSSEPHSVGKPVIATPTHSSVTSRTHRPSPFAAASRLCSAAASGSPRMSSSVHAIPSDSHLLWSTASRELKRATKRVPGGLMRECTFKPVINPSYEQSSVSTSASAIVQKRHPASSPQLTSQLNAEQLHQVRGSSAPSTRQLLHVSGGSQGTAAAVPLPASVETAVQRMISARRQWQRSQSPTPGQAKAIHLSTPAPQSAVRTRAAHPRKPLLYVDVDLPQGSQERLTLYAGDDVHDVALRFSILHGLSDSLYQQLATALTTQLHALSRTSAA